MEKLHFEYKSIGNIVKLLCTISFEKSTEDAELVSLWHKIFDGDIGDQLFEKFLEEIFPNGCTIKEQEIAQVTQKAEAYLKSEHTRISEETNYIKSHNDSWVYFIPTDTVYLCAMGEHTDRVVDCLWQFFGADVKDLTEKEASDFIRKAFEIRSDNTTVQRILRDIEFILLRAQNMYRKSRR